MKSETLIALSLTLLLICSCRHTETADSREPAGESVDSTESAPEAEYFIAGNDIGMTVRSVANTINIGESLDSTDFNFEGVLTDGIGMPLFTDLRGMPGQWEIEVIDSTQLRIRNLNTGNLFPHQLMEYISQNLGDENHTMELERESDDGDSHIQIYRYGRTTMSVITRPQPIGDTGEVAPIMEITLRADTLNKPSTPHADRKDS